MDNSNKNVSRIIKNTLLLYGRMLLLMIIGFYTTRIILQALGIIDYGISNVVGGLVAMFTMVSDTFSSTISRFITYNLGKGDKFKLISIFSTSVNIQIILSFFIVILMETIGLWFLEYKLIIPGERMTAARWVYQFSIINFVLNLICVPYNAAIVSHEKMDIYAYFGVFEGVSKLIIAFLILYSSWDKLVLYSLLSVVLATVLRLCYGRYCTKHFAECKYSFIFDKKILGEMFGFSGWNFLSTGAVVLRVQGTNIILNMFFGPVMNAAKGVANQLNALLNTFVANFMVALSPQITKSYASNDLEYMKNLAFQGAKFSYFIFLFVSIPILCDTNFIINFWLGRVPEHSVLFVRLIVVYTLLDTLSKTLHTSILAKGEIAQYQIFISIVEFCNLPISYYFLINGAIPEIVTVVNIFLCQICLLVRLFIAHRQLCFSIKEFLIRIYLRVIAVSIIATIFPIFVLYYLPESFVRFIIICLASMGSTLIVIYWVGCNHVEKEFLKNKISKLRKDYVAKL